MQFCFRFCFVVYTRRKNKHSLVFSRDDGFGKAGLLLILVRKYYGYSHLGVVHGGSVYMNNQG